MAALVRDDEARASATAMLGRKRAAARSDTRWWVVLVLVLLWCYGFAKLRRYSVELLQLYVVVSGFLIVGGSLWRARGRKRLAGPSAYAFLNEDGRRLPGDASMTAFGLPEIRRAASSRNDEKRST